MTANGKPKNRREWVLDALEQFEGRLVRYALRLLGDEQTARDAVQHAFMRLCDQRPEQFKGPIAPWLFAVCRNKAMDILRSTGRDRSRLDDCPDDPIGREPDPADVFEKEDLYAGLRRLVDGLPDGQREAIDLWLEGFTYTQIAEITGRREGSCRVMLHRALCRLRQHPWTRQFLEHKSSFDENRSAAPINARSNDCCNEARHEPTS